MNDYNELIESLRSMEPMVCSTAADAIEALQSRIGGLCAARIAYASEFPPDAEGLPDTGSIHANIRAMKARVAELESRLEISPLHNVDGIMARDATIKLQDERIAELEAERAEREKQEPIATVGWDRNFMGVVWHGKDMPEKGVETLLYAAPPVTEQGCVTVTTDESGRAVAVTRQDDDHRILSVIWEAPPVAAPVRLTDRDKDGLAVPYSGMGGIEDYRAYAQDVETAALRANGFKVEE